jgi:hypothetical protein
MVGTYTGGYWELQTLDASVLLAAHTSRVVRVSHRTIEWVASAAGDGAEVPLGEGVVRGITLPQHTEAGARESHTRVAVPVSRTAALPVSRTAALPAAAARGATGGQGDPWPDDTFDPAYDLSTTVSPTVQDDSIAVYRGPALVEPLANDSDPDGGRLAVCHAYSADEGLFATALDDQLYVDTSRAAVGTQTITYSACNAHRRSSARITLHVTRAQRLVVEKIPGTPSRLRVTNPNPSPAWIDADDFARTSTAVVHWVGAGASVVIPFHHRYGGWVAGIGGGGRAGSGRLARVALTRRDAAADRSEPMDVHERALVGVLPAP